MFTLQLRIASEVGLKQVLGRLLTTYYDGAVVNVWNELQKKGALSSVVIYKLIFVDGKKNPKNPIESRKKPSPLKMEY